MQNEKKTDEITIENTEKKAKNRSAKLGEMPFGDVTASVTLKADREPTPADRRRAVRALRELADDLEAKDAGQQ